MVAKAQNINSSMLAWAREKAGLSTEEAAKKLSFLSSSKKASATEKLEALELGDNWPTRKQLLDMAKLYRRPLTLFYLSKPPPIAKPDVDFRTLSAPVPRQESALLDALLRDVRVCQDLVRSILEDDEDMQPLAFVDSLTLDVPVKEAAVHIKALLKIEGDNWTKNYAGPDELFNDLRSRVEALGGFVSLIGNLGSHHTNISTEIFRGFAIVDDLAPFIVINDQDAHTAWVFTLIHELVHLFIGKAGISGPPPTLKIPITSTARIERFCNDVAGELLLPVASLQRVNAFTTMQQALEAIDGIAQKLNLSEPMIAYKLFRMSRLGEDIYSELKAYYASRWRKHKESTQEQRQGSSGGPSYYVVRGHRLSTALLKLVGRTLRENQLTHTTAARMLGVKPCNVESLLGDVQGFNSSNLPIEMNA